MWSASAALYRMSGPSGPPGLSGLPGMSGLSGIALCLSLVCVSAFTPHDATFRYQVLSSRRSETCTMCFGDDCWELQKNRCRYYSEISDVLPGREPAGEGGEVDDLVYDMVGQAASSWMSQECIPFISHHTDCNKENICVGCKSCSCDAGGRWRCKAVQQCRPEPYLDVDHRILVSVQDTLRDDKTAREKRDVKVKNKKSGEPHKTTYVDIAEWMYGVKPDVVPDAAERSTLKVTTKRTPKTTESTQKFQNIESDYIEFDEVLKNIAIDNQIYIRRKPQLNETNFEFKDYMDLDESIVVKNNETDPFVNMLNAIIEAHDNTSLEQTVEDSTKVVIDLLVPPKHDENSNVTNYINWNSNFIREDNNGDDANDTIVYDAINIMKRDVASVSNITTEATSEKINTSSPIEELKNNVLSPLTKIIDDKEQELKDLLKIKDKLIQFINNNSTDVEMDLKSQEVINNSNTILSIYNLDIFPDIQFNLRKINPHSLDKLLYKLKRDIYEVIRDVVGIRKLSGGYDLPNDLKLLLRAMSSYVHKQGNVTNFIKNDIKLKDHGGLRRHVDNEDNFSSTKDYLIKILEVLDKYMPHKGALTPLSQGTRKVVTRVIKTLYSDDFSVIALRVYDPEYNLTNDLKQIGSNWDRMTANVASSAPADKIYAMKLLHLIISVDINKLNDALALVDFAHSRRMIPIDGIRGEMVLERIDHGLKAIDEKIKTIMKYKSVNKFQSQLKPITNQSKKKSFLNKIRNLLKGSRSDVVELVNQKVPKSDIVKQIAKKRLDGLAQKKISEYQDIMRKWQNTLNVIPRHKRSIDLNKINNRMKNIIPKYLRGKLDPAIAAKKSKARQNVQNEATLKKRINMKHKKVISTTVKTKSKITRRKNARKGKSTINKMNVLSKRRPKPKVQNIKSLNTRRH